jgi:hypothetical protein
MMYKAGSNATRGNMGEFSTPETQEPWERKEVTGQQANEAVLWTGFRKTKRVVLFANRKKRLFRLEEDSKP